MGTYSEFIRPLVEILWKQDIAPALIEEAYSLLDQSIIKKRDMIFRSKLPKAAIQRIEIQARARMREKVKESDFLRRSLSIYNNQSRRAAQDKVELSYTIEEFRGWMKPLVNSICACGKKMTLKQISIDHNVPVSRQGSWTLDNYIARCKSCNWRKGILLPHEYLALMELLKTFTPESKEDVNRRLTIGGKWSFR